MISEKARLQRGQVVVIYITRVHNARRKFQKARVLHHTHDIYFTDAEGKSYVGEYVIPEETQELFKAGKYAIVECVFSSSLGDEIKPYGDVLEWDNVTFETQLPKPVEGKTPPVYDPENKVPLNTIDSLSYRKLQLLQCASTLVAGMMFANGGMSDDDVIEKTLIMYNALDQNFD